MEKINDSVTNLCGKRVKIARVSKDMNQLDLATALQVDFDIYVNQFSISQLERGRRYVKDYEIAALSDILEVNPLWLLFGDEIPEKYR